MRLAIALLLALVGFGPPADAQLRQAPPPQTRPRPAVDPLTAAISGRVTTADTGAPVRGAEVRAMNEGGVNRLAATDSDGRFELRDLPAGTYRLAVSKSGLVSAQFGQRRPTEAAATIDLAQGGRFTANVALLRGGVIAGRVFDRFGEPIAGVRVQALRSRFLEGRRRLQTVGTGDETDDTGSYRVHGLAPGDYYLIARPPEANQFPVEGAAPIYYPGTADFAEAQRVAVTAASEAIAMMQLVPVRTATVSGIVLDSRGAPVEAMVSLTSENVGLGYVNAQQGAVPFRISGHAEADGSFVLSGVPPGSYSLGASSGMPASDAAAGALPVMSHEMATVPLTVSDGGDIGGLTMTLSRGGVINGTLVRDDGVTRPLPDGVGVRATGGGVSMLNVGPNGTFRIMGAVGPVRLAVEGLPDGWTVKSIDADGTDVTDRPIEVASGRSLTVRVVLSDRLTEVSGSVASRTAPRGQTVVVFAEDATKWSYPSRFVKSVRTDDRGSFTIAGLPPGERYLAAAVEFLEEGAAEDPEVLERLRGGAVPFSLGEGERRTLDLRALEP